MQNLNEWRNDKKDIRAIECSYTMDNDIKIVFQDDIWEVVKELCNDVELEWQMFLIGTQETESDNILITDYIIPKQIVTGGSVTNEECVDQQYITEHGIIASMHSHGKLGVFFSGTDEETNLSEIKYHIVVNNRLEYKAVQQVSLPCGLKKQVDLDILLRTNKPKPVIKGRDNITENKFTYSYYGNDFSRYPNYNRTPELPLNNDVKTVPSVYKTHGFELDQQETYYEDRYTAKYSRKGF